MKGAYPSEALMKRYLEAYQKEGEAGIRRVLREQENRGEYIENLIRESVKRDKEAKAK